MTNNPMTFEEAVQKHRLLYHTIADIVTENTERIHRILFTIPDGRTMERKCYVKDEFLQQLREDAFHRLGWEDDAYGYYCIACDYETQMRHRYPMKLKYCRCGCYCPLDMSKRIGCRSHIEKLVALFLQYSISSGNTKSDSLTRIVTYLNELAELPAREKRPIDM